MIHLVPVICDQVACEDVGELPVKIELDVQLCWDEATMELGSSGPFACNIDSQKRTAVLRHRLLPRDPEKSPELPTCALQVARQCASIASRVSIAAGSTAAR